MPLLHNILNRRLLSVLAVFVLVGTLGIIAYANSASSSGPTNHTIELVEGGFSPSSITIEQGDSVTFTATERSGWPASDPHPTHQYLGGFDADRVLEIGDSWTYTFNEPGNWLFHDHETPSFTGEVVVINLDSVKNGGTSSAGEDCGGKCFDSIIRETVQDEGIEAAFALFQKTFESGELPRSCHWTAHQIGEEAYELFKAGKEFPITEATSYCAYGFFHGFLETLLRENPDVEYALSFCDRAEEQLGILGRQNCYHGIGHGFTEDPPDPRVHGDFQAMIDPGIEVCEYLFNDSFTNLNLCLTGVFTVPAGFAAKGEYGLSMDPDDPFAFCRTQPIQYQKACYGEFAPKLDVITDWELANLPQYVAQVPNERMKQLVVWVVPAVMMGRDIQKDDHTDYVVGCRENFEGTMRDVCIGGTILGFFNQGDPGSEYEPALRLCADDALLKNERELCYAETFHRIAYGYSEKQKIAICEQVPNTYQRQCLEGPYTSVYTDPAPFEGRWEDIVSR